MSTSSCPCQEAPIGAFMVGGCAYLATVSREFFGGDFLPILGRLLASPFDAHPVIEGWGITVLIGSWLIYRGIRQNIRDGDGAPVFWSLAAILACAVGFHHNRVAYPNGFPGPIHMLEAFYWGIAAACCANLAMAYGSHVRSPSAIEKRQRRNAQRATKMQIELAAENKRLAAENAEMRTVLAFPGVRPALLHLLHSDHHAALPAVELRKRDQVVASLMEIYQRIGGNGR